MVKSDGTGGGNFGQTRRSQPRGNRSPVVGQNPTLRV